MALLNIDSFTATEQKELEIFANQYMKDSNSATNGDSLRMGLTRKVINAAGMDTFYEEYDYINKTIDEIQANIGFVINSQK